MTPRSSIAATACFLLAIVGRHAGDPHADWFLIAGLVILGLSGRP